MQTLINISPRKNLSLKEFLYLGLVISLFILFAFTLISDFSFSFFYKVRFGEAFFDMWKRLIAGDVTISHSVLNLESYIINGQTIPYFLPFPATIRGFLSIFQMGEYPIPSILMGVTLYSISVYFLLKEVVTFVVCEEPNAILKAWYPFFLLPIASLFVEASIYWEAIIWALALFITQAFLFLSFSRNKKPAAKYLLLIVSSLILFTRPTYGVASGVLVAILFILDVKAGNYSIRNLLPYCVFIFALALLALLNYQRWGNPFEFAPLARHEQLIGTERGRMAAISPNLSVKRIPETLDYYFSVSRLNFSSRPPFINFGGATFPPKSYFDYKERYYSITLLLPFCVLASLFGVYILSRKKLLNSNSNTKNIFQLYLFISMIPAFLVLLLIAMSLRYRSEFYVFLIFTSMIGISFLQKTVCSRNIFISAFLVTLVAFVLVVNGLFAERYMFFKCGDRNPQAICTWIGA